MYAFLFLFFRFNIIPISLYYIDPFYFAFTISAFTCLQEMLVLHSTLSHYIHALMLSILFLKSETSWIKSDKPLRYCRFFLATHGDFIDSMWITAHLLPDIFGDDDFFLLRADTWQHWPLRYYIWLLPPTPFSVWLTARVLSGPYYWFTITYVQRSTP